LQISRSIWNKTSANRFLVTFCVKKWQRKDGGVKVDDSRKDFFLIKCYPDVFAYFIFLWWFLHAVAFLCHLIYIMILPRWGSDAASVDDSGACFASLSLSIM
jgi:hypothetical protein